MQRLGDLRHHLKKRGYNDNVIVSGLSKGSEINRNDLLEYKEKKINKRVPLVLTYHPSLEKIAGIVIVKEVNHIRCFAIGIANILYSFPVVLLWNTCVCCNWRQHLQRLSSHGLHWATVDEGLDTAALTSVCLMLLGRRNATTGGSGNNLSSVSLFSISFQ
jgi:hypothetical protein